MGNCQKRNGKGQEVSPLVGYLRNEPTTGLVGDPGTFYNYVLASNGLFVVAEKLGQDGLPLLRACVQVAPAEVRGLAPMKRCFSLPQGRIPADLWALALGMAQRARPDEIYMTIAWQDGYRLVVPDQDMGPGHVAYTVEPDTVINIHSHGHMEAFFSSTDNADDKGFNVAVVLGNLDQLAADVKARICVYGYFDVCHVGDIFI